MAKKRGKRVKVKSENKKFHDYVMSDQSRVNRYGYRILVRGIEILKFIIALDSHDASKRTIGHWDNIRVEGDKLLGRLYYNMNNPRAVEIYEDVESGSQNAVSMGLIPSPNGWSDAPEHLLKGQEFPTLVSCQMYECSPTNIPADAGAVRLYQNQKGKVLELSAVPILNSNQNQNQKKIMNPELIKLLALYGLSASTDVEAYTLLAKAKVDTEAKMTAQQTTLEAMTSNVESLVLSANADVLKTDSQKTAFKSIYASNPSAALEFVKSLKVDTGDTPPANENAATPNATQGVPDLAAVLAALQGGAVDSNDKRKGWDYLEWFRKDPEGLKKMRLSEPDKFLELKSTLKDTI